MYISSFVLVSIRPLENDMQHLKELKKFKEILHLLERVVTFLTYLLFYSLDIIWQITVKAWASDFHCSPIHLSLRVRRSPQQHPVFHCTHQ